MIQELQHDLAGLTEVNPESGGIARAHAVLPQAESGNIYLPHAAIASWVDALFDEALFLTKPAAVVWQRG